MSWNRIRGAGLRLAVLVPLLAITPLALSPEGVQENRACGQRAVCVERIGDVCYYNGNWVDDHYTKWVVE